LKNFHVIWQLVSGKFW